MFAPYPSQRRRVVAPHSDELVTKQGPKDECDIYTILDRFQRTGIFNHVTSKQPTFEELPDQHDYQEALNLVINAQEAFDSLPSAVREEFKNEPQALLAALNDPSKASRLREIGILKPLEVIAPNTSDSAA